MHRDHYLVSINAPSPPLRRAIAGFGVNLCSSSTTRSSFPPALQAAFTTCGAIFPSMTSDISADMAPLNSAAVFIPRLANPVLRAAGDGPESPFRVRGATALSDLRFLPIHLLLQTETDV
jgi:hypothetical protein